MSRRLEVLGKGVAVDLQTDERSYFVRCWLTSEAAVAPLSSGQLVALRGIGNGMNKDAPELNKCAVTWLGDPPGSASGGTAQNATVVAASFEICAARATAQALSDVAFDSAYLAKKSDEVAQAMERNRAVLAKTGAAALACDDPLVALVAHCKWLHFGLGVSAAPIVEGNRVFRSEGERELPPECAAVQVKEALEQLDSDQVNPHPDPLPKGEGENQTR